MEEELEEKEKLERGEVVEKKTPTSVGPSEDQKTEKTEKTGGTETTNIVADDELTDNKVDDRLKEIKDDLDTAVSAALPRDTSFDKLEMSKRRMDQAYREDQRYSSGMWDQWDGWHPPTSSSGHHQHNHDHGYNHHHYSHPPPAQQHQYQHHNNLHQQHYEPRPNGAIRNQQHYNRFINILFMFSCCGQMVIISICLFPILTPDLSIIYEATWDLDLATLTRLTNCSFISSTWNWTLSSVLSGQELYNVRMRVLENILRIMTTFLTHVLKMDSYPAATSQLPVTIIDTIMVSWEGDFLTRMLWRRSLGAASWQVGLQMTSLSTESIQSSLITVDPIIMLVGLVMDTLVKSPSHYSHLANYFSITRLQTSWA